MLLLIFDFLILVYTLFYYFTAKYLFLFYSIFNYVLNKIYFYFI